jgi:hypothetical protein
MLGISAEQCASCLVTRRTACVMEHSVPWTLVHDAVGFPALTYLLQRSGSEVRSDLVECAICSIARHAGELAALFGFLSLRSFGSDTFSCKHAHGIYVSYLHSALRACSYAPFSYLQHCPFATLS